jgi:hypothetical protein
VQLQVLKGIDRDNEPINETFRLNYILLTKPVKAAGFIQS